MLLDDDGNEMWVFGVYTRAAVTDYGVRALIHDGGGVGVHTTSFEINGQGMESPQIPLVVLKANDFVVVTSGAFADVWNAWASLTVSDSITWRGTIGCDVGTTGEAKLVSGATSSGVISLAAGAFTQTNWDWLHGFTQGGNRPYSLQVRRTGGAGNINVYPPYYVAQGGSAGLVSTPTGL
jgi:hypothetical protein